MTDTASRPGGPGPLDRLADRSRPSPAPDHAPLAWGPAGRLLAVAEAREGGLRYQRVLVTPDDLPNGR